jgi:hypothetical protein
MVTSPQDHYRQGVNARRRAGLQGRAIAADGPDIVKRSLIASAPEAMSIDNG